MTATKEFTIQYIFNSYCTVEVERPADISEKDLLESVTREDLTAGDSQEGGWDDLKEAWRAAETGKHYIAVDGEEVFYAAIQPTEIRELRDLERKIEASLTDTVLQELKAYKEEGGSIDIEKLASKVKVTLLKEAGE